MSSIAPTLTRLYERERHRIVFWYASEEGQRQRYRQLRDEGLGSVVFRELDGNAFTLKRELMRLGEDDRVLVFSPRPEPAPHDNWLLDLQLANYVFYADEGSIIATELGVDFGLLDTIRAHQSFFDGKERTARLTRSVAEQPVASTTALRLAMLGAELKVSPTLDDVSLALFLEASKDSDDESPEHYATLQRTDLSSFYWAQVKATYGYDADAPSVLGFCVFLCFGESRPAFDATQPGLPRPASLLLTRWKDSETYRPAFVTLSDYVAEQHHDRLAQALDVSSLEAIQTLDTYRLVDLRVLHELVRLLESADQPTARLRDVLEVRRNGLWYKHDARIRKYYLAVGAALDFQAAFAKTAYTSPTPQQALDAYAQHHHRVDEAYLRFYQYFYETDSDSVLKSLSDLLERRYTNEFLPRLNESWQRLLDDADGGPMAALASLQVEHQRAFYATHVRPSVEAGKELYVIVSDGLAYHSATRLAGRLKAAKRSVELAPGLAAIPSYTQLGMASLLPHERLEIALPKVTVLADGASTAGVEGREKVLRKHVPDGAIAMTAAEFIKQCTPSAKGRAWKQAYKIFYIYTDHIDKAGENSASDVPGATVSAFREIETVLKKISSINGRRAIVTADHGYLLQMSPVAKTGFLEAGSVEGEEDKSTRRFAIGQNLRASKGIMSFSACELGLAGEYDVAIPKNLLRLRKRGNDGRYAHGGMSLQELVTPVLQVRVKEPKPKQAEPVALRVTSIPSRLTTGQATVTLYQVEPVGGKRLPARVTAAFFSERDEPLTALHTLTFDSGSAEPREREQSIGFLFNRLASEYSGETVYLRVYGSQERKVELLRQAPLVVEQGVQMYVAFTSDFDL